MKRFKQLSSIVFLLIAFIYPPAIAEAKDNTQNHALNEQSIGVEANVVGGKSEELLVAHGRTRRHYYRRRVRHHYYRRRYRHRNYYRNYYRHGRWQRVRDRHGRLIYDRRYY